MLSIPAVSESQAILASLAPQYGYDPADTAAFNTKFRNPVFSFLSGERILVLYTTKGVAAVRAELDVCARQRSNLTI